MLQPGARNDRGVAVPACKLGKADNGAIDIPKQRINGRAQGQHGGGIDHVLAGGAPVHIARRIGASPGDLGGECLDKRDREVTGARCRLGQCAEVERTGFAGFRNRIGRARGDDAICRLGARERGFKIEHVLEACHVVADGAHGGARQHWCEKGREGSAHDACDLTVSAGLCRSLCCPWQAVGFHLGPDLRHIVPQHDDIVLLAVNVPHMVAQ